MCFVCEWASVSVMQSCWFWYFSKDAMRKVEERHFMHFYKFHIPLYLFIFNLFSLEGCFWVHILSKNQTRRGTRDQAIKTHLSLFKTTCWWFWSAMRTRSGWIQTSLNSSVVSHVVYIQLRCSVGNQTKNLFALVRFPSAGHRVASFIMN